MVVALKLSAPILIPALVIGFVISLIQSMTQIQEFTLAFVPKLVGVGVALLVSGNWMLHTLITYTQDLFARSPDSSAGRRPTHGPDLRGAPLIAYVLASIRLVAWLVIVPPFSHEGGAGDGQDPARAGLALTVAPQLAAADPAPMDMPACRGRRRPGGAHRRHDGLRHLHDLRRRPGRGRPDRRVRRILAWRRRSTRSTRPSTPSTASSSACWRRCCSSPATRTCW